ncbi:3'(2'),5'-bisphosphate nucleotidase CysQ [Sulfurimonas marina]|uniref:3'(2'),5'-bisphosphate nucleotidase CysQ n=1 Tax=Sulfurimonas marina TaxID=2590551 RepID=A0A7M1AYU5_9BACT|nr:3'(2'),5'-bisphosphate nucleotidase CysQ [Sulfurimonas marina]QOP41552.1 3'(2'),5'-bisphosphate nucleotidase CysQ [Sulfurimonas marina]
MLSSIDIEAIKALALEAGEAIMKIYVQDFAIEYKEDNSPLTEADLKANEIICSTLEKLYPNIPIMSEETQDAPYSVRKNWDYYWCIDPIDGTKEFIKKNGEFTVNIALIHKDTPVLGVVYAPVKEELYWAVKDQGAFKNGIKLPLKINHNPEDKLLVLTSRSHLTQETKDFIASFDTKKIEQKAVGSSLKLCMIAAGEADIYPKLGPTSEWDTAAADAILREAGKMVYQFDLTKPLVYNKEELLNPWFIVK